MENVEIHVPDKVDDDAEFARWRINGALKIRTRDQATA